MIGEEWPRVLRYLHQHFLLDAISRIDRSWWRPSSYGRHRAPLPAVEHTTINKHTMRQDYIVKTRKKSLIMFISYSKSLNVDKSSSVMFTGRDGRTADAEHQQQQRRRIHIVYGPPRDRYAWFAMPAMLGASTAEVR